MISIQNVLHASGPNLKRSLAVARTNGNAQMWVQRNWPKLDYGWLTKELSEVDLSSDY